MAAPYYPRQAFAAPPHTWSQAELDYLDWIRRLALDVDALKEALGIVSDGLITELGAFMLTEAGDSIALEA